MTSLIFPEHADWITRSKLPVACKRKEIGIDCRYVSSRRIWRFWSRLPRLTQKRGTVLIQTHSFPRFPFVALGRLFCLWSLAWVRLVCLALGLIRPARWFHRLFHVPGLSKISPGKPFLKPLAPRRGWDVFRVSRAAWLTVSRNW